MDEHQFKQVLRAIAHEEVSADMDRWDEIKAKLNGVPKSSYSRPSKQVVRLLLVAILIIVFSASAYAVYQNNNPHFPGVDGARQAELVTELNLSQTVDNVTVTLLWAYADDTQITIEFETHFTDENGTSFQATGDTPFNARLLDGEGHLLFRYPVRTRTDSNIRPTRATFELTPELAARLPDQLDVQFELIFDEEPRTRTFLDIFFNGARTSGGASFGGKPIAPESTAEAEPMTVPEGGVGPFSYRFSLPLRRALFIEPNMTVTHQDVPITINRVTVAPSKTEFEVCLDTSALQNADRVFWNMDTTLEADGVIDYAWGPTGGPFGRSSIKCGLLTFNLFLPEYPASLKLTVNSLDNQESGFEEWEKQIKLLAEVGVKAEIRTTDGGSSLVYPDLPGVYEWDSEDRETLHAALVKIGYRYEGPWVFDVKLPVSPPSDE